MKVFPKEDLLNESRRMLSLELWWQRLLFWGGGVAVGLVCVAFAYVCDLLNAVFMQNVGHYLYFTLLLTPLGFVAIVWSMRRYFPGSEGSGIPQVMAALEVDEPSARSRLVSLRIAIGKFFLTALGFCCGASIGREGPTVQLAASVMHAFKRWGTFDAVDMKRGLLLAGGAAGIAAAFNTPLAGIMFAIEELSSSFDKKVSYTIIITVVISGIIAQATLGNYLYFGRSTAQLDLFNNWFVVLAVATVGGLIGGMFSRMLLIFSNDLRPFVTKYPLRIAATMGLLMAILGIFTHGAIFGSGYNAAKELIMGQSSTVPVAYGFWKMLATLLTYLSGIPGGIFAPSLSAGAGFGELFSHFFAHQDSLAIVLLGTVAYFSGVVQSPLTATIIVSEMTANTTSGMLLPIMLTAMLATAASKVVCREPLYHALSQRYLKWVAPEVK